MVEMKTFEEILNQNLYGKWCDGFHLLELDETFIRIERMGRRPSNDFGIDKFSCRRGITSFVRVTEADYETAIKELLKNGKTIKSPIIKDKIGGNLFELKINGKIAINTLKRFEEPEWLLNNDFISEEEKEGKWLVF